MPETQAIREAHPLRETLGLKIYRAVSGAARPLADIVLNQRLKAGKEDASRIDERRGIPGQERPNGPLVWIHGASVGESLSILPLVNELSRRNADISFVVTTGTVTSAQLMSNRLPERAVHQYAPVDHPSFVDSFLDHWRPDAVFFVESEFWPNLIEKARKAIPFMALVNGRMSPRSFADWQRQPNSIRYLLSAFDVILAQDNQNAERLAALSGRDVKMLGNLKYAAAPLPAEQRELDALRRQFSGRPLWLAASTHPREEETVLSAHEIVKQSIPDIATIIAPRHPTRGGDIRTLATAAGLTCAQRSADETMSDTTDIYIADTLGELGLLYRLSDIAFIGGSMIEKGGHNPLEPAQLGSAILHGPNIFNFQDTYRDMRRSGGAALVRNERELASAIQRILKDEKTRAAIAEAARIEAQVNADKILHDISNALFPNIPTNSQHIVSDK